MKKFFLLIVMLMSYISIDVYGQGKLEFEKEEIDLGEINTDISPFKAFLRFKNIGNEPVVIIQAIISNNKWEVTYPKSAIAPNQEGYIIVEGTDREGPIKRSVMIRTNCGPYRISISAKNLGKGLLPPEFVGQSVQAWINTNKRKITGLHKNIIYKSYIHFRVGQDNRLQHLEYSKDGVPKSITDEIDRLGQNMPSFEPGHSFRGSFFISFNDEITNPSDKPEVINSEFYSLPEPIKRIITEAVESTQVKSDDLFVTYIHERDGSFSNIKCPVYISSLQNTQYRSKIEKFASLIETKMQSIKITNDHSCREQYVFKYGEDKAQNESDSFDSLFKRMVIMSLYDLEE